MKAKTSPGRRTKPARRPTSAEAKLRHVLGSEERLLKKLAAAKSASEARLEKLRARLAARQARAGVTPELLAYRALVRRVRAAAGRHVPAGTTVLVVTRGDEDLLKLSGRTAWHFPRTVAGGYPGYHPANDLAAIAQLEAWRAAGAKVLVLPEPSFWWLEHYAGFRRHLESRYRLMVRDDRTAAIWSLTGRPRAAAQSWPAQLAAVVADFQSRRERDPAVLNMLADDQWARQLPHLTIFTPTGGGATLAYLDRTVDLVVVADDDAARGREAERVASAAVIRVHAGGSQVSVTWQPDCPSGTWPRVSVIMPCHNGRAMTDACLRSLFETLPNGLDCEVIVVDDHSTDGTAAMLRGWAKREPRITVQRQRKNLGFVDACNRGAAAASHEMLVFLNNDLVLLPGWLEPLLAVFRDCVGIGVCGGRLIYPDGTLQEAGSVVFQDGSAMNFGRDSADIGGPLFTVRREVDYCSAALFATPREVFRTLGGFGAEYRPGYYEDTDYCFKVRQAGLKVYCEPESAVVHREGGTAGTDVAKGMKRHQVINRGTFVSRWSAELAHQPARPPREDLAARLALAARVTGSRGRALVCGLMPQCDRDSGSRRLFDLLVFLQEAGWAVTFVSYHGVDEPRYARILQKRGIAVFTGAERWLRELISAGNYDLAVFGLWHVAEPFVPAVRTLSPRTRIVVDSVDLHFLRLARGAFSGGGRQLDAGFATGMMREMNTYASVDAVLTVSAKEANLINDLAADTGLAHAVPDNEDVAVASVPLPERKGMVFVGCYRHEPNVGAVEYLCREIVPRLSPSLLREHPIYIVGDGLSETVAAFGAGLPDVRMVGWTPSVLPYLSRARISVIPLLFGAGTKRKVLQSLMLGTPAVTTSVGAEGFGLRDGHDVFVADDPELFAQRITELLEDDGLWTALARSGRAHIERSHGREAVRGGLVRVIDHVMERPPKTPAPPREPAPAAATQQLPYAQLVTALVDAVNRVAPSDSTVLVASRGDSDLLKLSGRKGRHFPQGQNGAYAGHHPADGASAVSHLEALRRRGGQFLVLPATAFWWFDHYRDFAEHLSRHYKEVFRSETIGVVYDLRAAKAASVPGADADPVKLIAFHLPQFHPIPENDAWWGDGFTEWTNVRRATPAFAGHHQPRVPGELGYYDLRDAQARAAQAALAREHGIHGFCYYHYWFGGKRLLEQPFNEILARGEPDFPFCLCWANEPWSRRWDGREEHVLQPQVYSPEDDVNHIRWLIPALRDRRAIHIAGKPVFVVYQGRDLPDPARTVATWRREVASAGLPGVYLMTVETGWDAGWDATAVGFDAKILFAPQFTTLLNSGTRIPVPGKDKLRVFDYRKAWRMLAHPTPVPYLRYETVCPMWDNSARRGDEAVVLHHATPSVYERWLRSAVSNARTLPPGQRVVFLNAWNEWAEGAHLEPDQRHGRAYLEATRRAWLSGSRAGARARARSR